MKRFYQQVGISAEPEGGFGVMLDTRKIRTPGRTEMVLPDRDMADLVAAEWEAQPSEFSPSAMVVNKCANTAIDQLPARRMDFEHAALVYANDLLCYRAISPRELVAKQAREWDPLLDWFKKTFDVRLMTGQGVTPIRHPKKVLMMLNRMICTLDSFTLVALAGVADALGSLVLAMAVAEGRLSPEKAFRLSRLEEDYQHKNWGHDAEADKIAADKAVQVKALGAFLRLARRHNQSVGRAA